MQVLRLRDELEVKVRVISLPVDICVQLVVRGNSALQGALDVALAALRDIEEFEESLRNQDVAVVRHRQLLISLWILCMAFLFCNDCFVMTQSF